VRARIDFILLPRANLVRAYQEVTMGANFKTYNLTTNSSVTYCAKVLNAGGVGEGPTWDPPAELRQPTQVWVHNLVVSMLSSEYLGNTSVSLVGAVLTQYAEFNARVAVEGKPGVRSPGSTRGSPTGAVT
jgi:hypothetical protein